MPARTDATLAPRIASLSAGVEQRLLELVRVMVGAPASPELDERAGVLVNTLRGPGLLWAIGAPRPSLSGCGSGCATTPSTPSADQCPDSKVRPQLGGLG